MQLGGADNQVVIEKEVPSFRVEALTNVRRTIVFQLHSELWATARALSAPVVEDAALQSAVTVSTRSDPVT